LVSKTGHTHGAGVRKYRLERCERCYNYRDFPTIQTLILLNFVDDCLPFKNVIRRWGWGVCTPITPAPTTETWKKIINYWLRLNKTVPVYMLLLLFLSVSGCLCSRILSCSVYDVRMLWKCHGFRRNVQNITCYTILFQTPGSVMTHNIIIHSIIHQYRSV
jgi:hypothetical protein